MKKVNIPGLFVMFAMIIVCPSCKKYLDEKSNKSLIVPTTLTDLQGLLDNNDHMNQRTTPGFGETSSDDYFLKPDTYNSMNTEDQSVYRWSLKNYSFNNDWASSYTPVYYSNICFEQIEKIERNPQNEEQWKNIKGSALFFRAYYFSQLAWVFAKAYDETTAQTDPGIVLRLGSDFNVPSKRSSVKESYDQIIHDLSESVKYLPDHPLHTMRPSKAAAYGLLARVYLSMRQYDSAFKYADLCLQLKSDLLDYKSASDVNPSSINPFKPYHKETIFFTSQTGNFPPKSVTKASIDTVLYSLYGSNDIRKSAFFRSLNGYYSFKGSYTGAFLFLFSGIAVDEMYLIRAETHARIGRVTEAMNDLNTLLTNRFDATFLPLTASTQQEALDIILTERRKELVMRGLRWIDIKRLNKEGAGIIPTRVIGTQVYTLQPNENRYALPLPADIVELTGLLQNPGW